ncbi:MAG: DNA polymerase III subunit alpha [Bacillota bacterium]|nr:error-prone DNA polymerase [Bacillota bacterium]
MFTHLHVHSCYSFLDGASTPRQLVQRAADLGMQALALTDHDSVAGAVEFYRCAREAGIKPIQGAEVTVAPLGEEGDQARPARSFHLVLLAEGPAGYANLCRILSDAHLQNPRGQPLVTRSMLEGRTGGLIALSGCRRGEVAWRLLRGDRCGAERAARALRGLFGPDRFYLELQADRLPGQRRLHRQMRDLAGHLGVGLAASNNVHYHERDRFWLHDLLTCVRCGLTIDQVHPERRLNAENDLKPAADMAAAFADLPEALRGTAAIAERCRPALDLDARLHPAFAVPPGMTAERYLRELAYRGAQERYGRLTGKIRRRLDHELDIINRLGYADYFLLVWDVVRFARSRGIRCAGRGSAADSAVAYCLYITEVDAIERGLLFERFMSLERAERPDIDIDFDWRYRDQVADYVYRRYGAGHVAAVCTYQTYRGRAAIRDFGKVLEFPDDEIDRLAKRWYGSVGDDALERFERVPELRDSGIAAGRYRRLLEACAAVRGFPRHLGTHLGGLVISRRPLVEVTPLQRSAKGIVVSQFDKRGVEDLGLVKLDLLPLRTFGAVDDAVRAIQTRDPGFDDQRVPLDDQATFRMIRRGETVGVFQLESPAQRALHPRLKAETMEDIVASVAIIRPGPIKGNMVEPFLRRRRGEEPVTYLHPKLKPILEKTWGVVLFQEQVIEIATAIAGFTPGEADRLRRVMTHARSHEDMEEIGRHFVDKARRRGISDEVARTVFSYIQGYASYGFCEAHAAAFATTAFKTAYLIRHYPAEFFAAVLSHQPMGYYPPNTVALEARRRGVKILPLDINASGGPCTVEYPAPGARAGRGGRGAIRLGFCRVKGIRQEEIEAILAARDRDGPFRDVVDFARRLRGRVARDTAERLVRCGAFDGVEPHRRRALWRLARAWRQGEGRAAPLEVLAAGDDPDLPDFDERERWLHTYDVLGIDVHYRHFMTFFRESLRRRGVMDTRQVRRARHGTWIETAGVVIRPHRPPTRSGRTIVYFMLEDEHGIIDVTMFEDVYREQGGILFGEAVPPLVVAGRLDRKRGGLTVVARRVRPL